MLTGTQIKNFSRDGFLIVRSFFSENEVAPILDACRDTHILDRHSSFNKDFLGNDSFRAAFWRDPHGPTLLAKLPLMPRIVNASCQLLDSEIYYWRSRLVYKKPHDPGRIEDHQDYSFWYHDGCVFPDMLSCSVAITPSTRENGCLEILRGSHHVGRLDLIGYEDGAEYPDPRYVEKIAERCERFFCELAPGDGIFFHGNTVHGSGPNTTEQPRILIHNTYNAVHNSPLIPEGQSELLSCSQAYEALLKADDNFIEKNQFSSVFDNEIFFPSESSGKNEVGIFKRKSKSQEKKDI